MNYTVREMNDAFMTLYVSTLWMSYEVSGATSLCFTFIPISMRICRSVHYLRFLLTFGKKSLPVTCAMMDQVSDRSINRLPIHHLNGFFCNIQVRKA